MTAVLTYFFIEPRESKFRECVLRAKDILGKEIIIQFTFCGDCGSFIYEKRKKNAQNLGAFHLQFAN